MGTKLAAVGGMLFLAAPVCAADRVRVNDQWSLFENEDNCAVMSSYNDGSVMRIAYDHARDNADITIVDPAFKSIEKNKQYKLRLMFLKPAGGSDTGWGEINASSLVTDEFKGFSVQLDGATFLTDFAIYSGIAFFRGDILVTSLRLNGSASAAQALRACSIRVQKARPIDPFKD